MSPQPTENRKRRCRVSKLSQLEYQTIRDLHYKDLRITNVDLAKMVDVCAHEVPRALKSPSYADYLALRESQLVEQRKKQREFYAANHPEPRTPQNKELKSKPTTNDNRKKVFRPSVKIELRFFVWE